MDFRGVNNTIAKAPLIKSRLLSDLHPIFYTPVCMFLAHCVQENLRVRVLETRRSIQQHKLNVVNGDTFLTEENLSRHCFGLAIDVVPTVVLKYEDWAPKHKAWFKLYELSKPYGFVWGGNWRSKDCAHFQLQENAFNQSILDNVILWGK